MGIKRAGGRKMEQEEGQLCWGESKKKGRNIVLVGGDRGPVGYTTGH